MAIEPIRVMLVEDHELVRAGFRRLLEDTEDLRVVGEASSGEEACQILRELKPDILVLDISLPGISGIEVIGRVLRLVPGLRVVVLSMHEEEPFPTLALGRGASGYLSKRSAPEELVRALRQVARGHRYLAGDIAQRLALERVSEHAEGLARLSPREFEVFSGLVRGKTVNEIAASIYLSPKTVHVHRANLLRKLGVRTTAELVRIAIRDRVLDVYTAPP